MAHFAALDENNIVQGTIRVSDDTVAANGICKKKIWKKL